MKIYSASTEELKRRRDEWDSRRAQSEENRQNEINTYNKERRRVLSVVENYLNQELSKFSLLTFEMYVDTSLANGQVNVNIECDGDRLHDEASPLTWEYSVTFDRSNGEVNKSSSSWSGLNATTEENIDSLKQTVSALEFLNSVNWKTVLDVKLPDYSEYVSDDPILKESRPNFEEDILLSEIQDYVESGVPIRGYGNKSYEGSGYWIFEKETSKKLIGIFVPDYVIKNRMEYDGVSDVEEAISQGGYSDWFWKRDISEHVSEPIETI